ncbi:MAG: phosphotriesterase family protein [Geodermatophilaceae bacterium]
MQVRTVAGPVDPDTLGATLMHEHVLALVPGRFFTGGRYDDAVEAAERALRGLSEHGVGAVVDLTGRTQVGSGPDIAALREISARTGIAIVAGAGLYKEPFPGWVEAAAVDEVADRFVAMAADAGIFGEVGTSLDVVTAAEEKCLRAAVRAHRRTGLGISTHCTLGAMAREQVAIMASEGADLRRVVIGHLDLAPDLPYLQEVLATGVTIAFDTFGKEWFDYQVPGSEGQGGGEFVKWAYHRPDSDRFAALITLLERGYAAQLVLSSDISGREAYLNPDTHGRHGYSFVHAVVLPALRSAGVGAHSIQQMLVHNPARILTIP